MIHLANLFSVLIIVKNRIRFASQSCDNMYEYSWSLLSTLNKTDVQPRAAKGSYTINVPYIGTLTVE